MEKVGQCLVDNHKLIDPDYTKERSEFHYRSEDFADYFSAKYGQGENFACYWLPQKDDQYDVYNPREKEAFRLQSKRGDMDVHSPKFFRALQNYFYRNGEYPKACLQLSSSLKKVKDCSSLSSESNKDKKSKKEKLEAKPQ